MRHVPAISVLVPCYNVEKYLGECLGSLEKQTFEDIEVLCINDGSTDATKSIIESFVGRDSRFRLIDKSNSGYGASMNRGLDEAQGVYVAILESDDFMEANALETLFETAERHQSDVAKANFYYYWSKPVARNEKMPLVTRSSSEPMRPIDCPQIFWYMPSIWSALYRRDFLMNNEIRFLETPGASYQDLSFTFKVWAQAEKVMLLQEAFVHYRQDNESSSINSPGKTFCVCDEFDEIDRFIETHPNSEALWPIKTRLMFDSYTWNYGRLSEDLRSQFFPRMCSDLRKAFDAGYVNYDYYLPGSELDLRSLLDDPQGYCEWKKTSHSRLSTLFRYFRVGGLSLLKKRMTYGS